VVRSATRRGRKIRSVEEVGVMTELARPEVVGVWAVWVVEVWAVWVVEVWVGV
jgi:hypothetical protein